MKQLFIVFGLTQQGIEHTVYYIWDEHANHYTTEQLVMNEDQLLKSIWQKLYPSSKNNTKNNKICIFSHYYENKRRFLYICDVVIIQIRQFSYLTEIDDKENNNRLLSSLSTSVALSWAIAVNCMDGIAVRSKLVWASSGQLSFISLTFIWKKNKSKTLNILKSREYFYYSGP